jgi:hypothetical protein
MKIEISNIRGIASAIIETVKITVIAGLNAAGKTSAIQSIGSAFTGNPLPIEGMKKSNAGRMVRSGTGGGFVLADNGLGESKIDYPEAVYNTTGTPVTISEWSAGFRSIVNEPVKQRGDIIADILKTNPTKEALESELKKIGASENGIKRLWDTVAGQGWDAAHAQAKETGAKLKGQWEGITGERFGDKKAKSWMPAAWDSDLERATEAELISDISKENSWLECAISEQAVGETELIRLKTEADKIQDLAAQIAELSVQTGALLKNRDEIEAGLSKMPRPEQPVTQPCPHCQKAVAIDRGKIVAPVILEAAEIEKRSAAIKQANDSLQAVKTEYASISTKNSELQASLKICQAAKTEYEKAIQKKGSADQSKVEECRQRVATAQNRLAAYKAKTTADKLAYDVSRNEKIIDLLAPDGLRLNWLKDKIGAFNETMQKMCEIAEWGKVELRPDMAVSFKGTLYMLCSKSEQFRVQTVLQMAIAEALQDPVVLIDGADILDAPGRNGLFNLLAVWDLNAIVGMTLSPNRIPDLSSLGGRIYWLENGNAKLVSQE